MFIFMLNNKNLDKRKLRNLSKTSIKASIEYKKLFILSKHLVADLLFVLIKT